jgi:hypothetical protein
MNQKKAVTPAKAGVQCFAGFQCLSLPQIRDLQGRHLDTAFAGMTFGLDFMTPSGASKFRKERLR